ncbi:hypothetical protein LguiB_013531 [Lonicera macranthoides]
MQHHKENSKVITPFSLIIAGPVTMSSGRPRNDHGPITETTGPPRNVHGSKSPRGGIP